MKNLLLLTFSLFTCLCSLAQAEKEDVLYLKNGSIIRGKIISPQVDDKVKIELLGGSLFVFSQAEIDSIRQVDVNKAKLNRFKKDYYRHNRGFRNMTEMGIVYGPGQGNNNYYYNTSVDDFGFSVSTVNGYQLWPYLYVAGGIGIDRYATYRQTFSPFFLRLASEFLKTKVTPYVYADLGYAVMWKQKNDDWTVSKNKGGLYVAAGAGVRIYTRSRASVVLSAGYKRTQSETRWYYIGNEGVVYNTNRTYHRMVFNVGVSF